MTTNKKAQELLENKRKEYELNKTVNKQMELPNITPNGWQNSQFVSPRPEHPTSPVFTFPVGWSISLKRTIDFGDITEVVELRSTTSEGTPTTNIHVKTGDKIAAFIFFQNVITGEGVQLFNSLIKHLKYVHYSQDNVFARYTYNNKPPKNYR